MLPDIQVMNPTYRVNEIYAGLEGEGAHVGFPCIRIRLQGCTQPCKLRKVCDQQSALPVLETGSQEWSLDDIRQAVRKLDRGAERDYPWICISGGEPLEQEVEQLAYGLKDVGRKIRLETSGMARSLRQICEVHPSQHFDYIRVSPKEPAPRLTKQTWGTELSVVWTGAEDLKAWRDWGALFHIFTIQPLVRPDGSSNLNECIQMCLANPRWGLSVQVHKLIGIN